MSAQPIFTLVIVALLVGITYWLGRSWASVSDTPWIPVGLMFLTASSYCFLNTGLLWATAFPYATVSTLANLVPALLLSYAAGAFSRSPSFSKSLRAPLAASLVLSASLVVCFPIARPLVAPALLDSPGQSHGAIVLQTHPATCAPSAAATLLRLNGIHSDERSMAKSCLTCAQGTEALGLFGGLASEVNSSQLRAKTANSNPATWKSLEQFPNVAIVYFPENEYDQTAHPKWFAGSIGDAGHVVVMLGHKNGRWAVVDPACGLTSWSDEEFRRRFTGDAIYLEAR